jgi:tRNA/rRNA methyltransferase
MSAREPGTSERPARERPAVVLVRPRQEGNIGAAARAMANMGLDELLLVEPAAALGPTARAFAVGATGLLERATRHPTLDAALGPFERAVGTTSGRDRDLTQRLVTARELGGRLAAEPGQRTALVFGPETSGLTRDELALLDPLVTIPCSARQPTLNLAQAVLLVAYELQLAPADAAAASPGLAPPAPTAEIERLFTHAGELLSAIGFDRDDTYSAVLRDLRRLSARARPTDREIQILHGICRRALNAQRLGARSHDEDRLD